MKLMMPTRIAIVLLLSSVAGNKPAYAGQVGISKNLNGAGYSSNTNGRSLRALISLEDEAEDCLDFHAVRYDDFVSEEACRGHCVLIGPEMCLAYAFHEEDMACFLKTPCAIQSNTEDPPLPTEPPLALFPSLLAMLEELPGSLSSAVTSSFPETNDDTAGVMSPAPLPAKGDDSAPRHHPANDNFSRPPAPPVTINLLPNVVGSQPRLRLSNATKIINKSHETGTVSNHTEGISHNASLNDGRNHQGAEDNLVDGMNAPKMVEPHLMDGMNASKTEPHLMDGVNESSKTEPHLMDGMNASKTEPHLMDVVNESSKTEPHLMDGMNARKTEPHEVTVQDAGESDTIGLDEAPQKLATKFRMQSRFRCIQKPLKETQGAGLKTCKSECKEDLACSAFSYDRINKICTTHESGCRLGSDLVFSKGYKTGVKELYMKGEVVINGAMEQQVQQGWGTSLDFDEPCASGHGTDKYYHCNADCAANCREMDPLQTGLLVPTVLKSDLQYCDSVHSKESYGTDVCCCGEVWDADKRSEMIVPCEGDTSAWNACDAWCRLHSAQLGAGTAADCRPQSGWCFPYGLLTHQHSNANELCSSMECSGLKCCCDQQVA